MCPDNYSREIRQVDEYLSSPINRRFIRNMVEMWTGSKFGHSDLAALTILIEGMSRTRERMLSNGASGV